MRTLKIIFKNKKSNPISSILGIIIVGISVFMMNVSLSRFMYQEYINSLVKDCGLYDEYMYSAPPDKDVYFDDSNSNELGAAAVSYIQNSLEGLKSSGVIEAFYDTASFNGRIFDDSDERGYYLLYPKEFLCDVKFPTDSGAWFDKYDFGDGITPVVIGYELSSKFKVGGVYELSGIDGEARVIGVLERNAMMLRCGAGGTGMNLNNVFRNSDNMIVVCADNIAPSVSSNAKIIKTSENNFSTVLSSISDIAYTFSFKELADTAYENNKLISEMQFVVFLLMMLVCITCVSSNNLLNTLRCKKKYAIYFMCGMTGQNSMNILFFESLLDLIIPSVIGYCCFLRWCREQNFSALRATDFNILATVILVVCVFALTLFLPMISIKNTSPVKIISEI